MSATWPAKDPAESLVCAFDFTAELDPGETISSVLVSVSLLAGVDPDPAAMLHELPTIAAGVVLQPFRAGVHGAVYKLRCVATLDPTVCALALLAKRIDSTHKRGNGWTYALPEFVEHGG